MKFHLACYVIFLLSTSQALDFLTVESLVGHTVELPCNVSPEVAGDKLSVLAWYKNDSSSSKYSSRDQRDDQDGSSSAENARYSVLPGEMNLRIDGVTNSDAGFYYCSVDFAASRANKSHVRLIVIEPPQSLWVVHLNGTRIATANAEGNANANIGPYYIGDTVSLYCVTFGGDPQPTIIWLVNGSYLKNTSTPLSQQRVLSNLSYGPLKREDHGTTISCLANNDENNDRSLLVDVFVDMTLPAELVSIRTNDASGFARVKEGDALALQCRVLGAQPPPAVLWALETGQTVRSLDLDATQNITTEPSQHLLVSAVTLDVARWHDEARVTCCAVSRGRGADDTVCGKPLPISVEYPPSMEIKTNVEKENNTVAVPKGSCLRLNCSVHANPAIFELTWYHEDTEILSRQSVEGGTIDPILELTLNETDAGAYSCSASNNEGTAKSESLVIDVVYPPFCEDTTIAEYGLGENEPVNITCSVKANPEPAIYRWVIVSEAANITTLKAEKGTAVETDNSVLSFVRPNNTAISTIFCWGINEVASELSSLPNTPCTYWVTAETVPRPPTGCGAVRAAGGEITVACEKGHNGGLPQKFTLTLLSTDSEEQIMSITSLEPKFIVQQPGLENFKFQIISSNKKGDSRQTVEICSEDIESEAQDIVQVTNTVADITTLALALCGGVALLALAACGLVLCAHAKGADLPRGGNNEPPLTAYNTEESNCETCHNSDDESEYHLRRTDSFRRAVARQPARHFDIRRTSSFHSPRCLNDEETFKCNEPIRHSQTCRVHSMLNISRKREMDALCDHLATQLPPEPNYNVPRPANTFYTMPRKIRSRKEISDNTSEMTQNSDGFSLPPPPDEFVGYRVGTRIKDMPTKSTPTYSTITRKDARKDPSRLYNNVIISPMNTVGLPAAGAAPPSLYSYPDTNQVNNNNPFESQSNSPH